MYFGQVDTYHSRGLGGQQCGPAERWGGGGGGRPRRRREDLRGARGVGGKGRQGEAPRGRGWGISVGSATTPGRWSQSNMYPARKIVCLDPSPPAAFLYVKFRIGGG